MPVIDRIYLYSRSSKKKSADDQNFRICFIGGQYVACDADAPITMAGTVYEEKSAENLPPAVRHGKGTARKSHMTVAYDDPTAPYKGAESAVNDGVEKNKERNINYLDNSTTLPPNDGGLSNKNSFLL